ncbi:outer membrane protein with beta-barrel domain [Hasllibacter halocynthiae]|uniref:Outer membrane protein with beta-barrel domain n=1 Tax=Hasllibacter halocynthiae TaxID=595589 RepID=A0A2T0X8R6_9RHOB|nr:outer membrane beta-barrel protein [Hasllibacter halocynthiae]PRY95340.1 outer membrane protein with beta-barrel domain [Hasllibacter halocynthiae]
MNIRIAAAGLLPGLALGLPVHAGGLADEAFVVQPVLVVEEPLRFSGPWVGGAIGALGLSAENETGDDADPDWLPDDDIDGGGDDHAGGTIGLRAGYDLRFENVVVGAMAAYDRSATDFGGAGELEAIARAGLRLGLARDRNLFYLAGGWARAYTEGSDGDEPADDTPFGDSDGYFAGLGYERLMENGFSVGGEILYHEFDEFRATDVEVDVVTAQITVAYRF